MTSPEIALYNEENEKGRYLIRSLRRTGGENRREDRPSMFYPIITPDGTEIFPIAPEGWESRWVCGKETFEKLVQKNLIVWKKIKKVSGEKWQVYQKHYLNGTRKESSDLWTSEAGNKKGTRVLNALFGSKKVFNHPKPVDFLKNIIRLGTSDNDIVLDFFAGSGGIAHAVMDLNRDDEGKRKFILVQIPELTDPKSEAYKAGYKKISDITIERNKRVIEKYEKEDVSKEPDLFKDDEVDKQGFKVYKLSKSNFPRVELQPDSEKTEEENIERLKKYIADKQEAFELGMKNQDDLFDEVLFKNGFMLNYKLQELKEFTNNKVYLANDEFKECLITLDMNIDPNTLIALKNYKDKLFICLEQALDTTMKWNLKHLLGDKLIAF